MTEISSSGMTKKVERVDGDEVAVGYAKNSGFRDVFDAREVYEHVTDASSDGSGDVRYIHPEQAGYKYWNRYEMFDYLRDEFDFGRDEREEAIEALNREAGVAMSNVEWSEGNFPDVIDCVFPESGGPWLTGMEVQKARDLGFELSSINHKEGYARFTRTD